MTEAVTMRGVDPVLIEALGGFEEYSRIAREWMERIREPDATMPQNWMYYRRLYLEGLAKAQT